MACYVGNLGFECLMSCRENYSSPGLQKHYQCLHKRGSWNWIPVDCSVPRHPKRIKVRSAILYNYNGSCEQSGKEIQQKFLERLRNSLYDDACNNVPSCVVENVQVTCGVLARVRLHRRQHRRNRHRRSKEDVYLIIEFDIVIEPVVDDTTPAFNYTKIGMEITTALRENADKGLLDIAGLTTSAQNVKEAIIRCDCPPGTACFAAPVCVGCSKGMYMPENSTECLECPYGTYQSEDAATACTPCPSGLTTFSTRSQSLSQCKELACPTLTAPANGALVCSHTFDGFDCIMSCNELWDVPLSAQYNGHFRCSLSQPFWVPDTVPDCTARRSPRRMRVHIEMFYFTGGCRQSEDSIRQVFLEKLNQSYPDACNNVSYCVPENFQFTCGESGWGGRHRRSAQNVVIRIEFDIVMDYVRDAPTSPDYRKIADDITERLTKEASEGLFNFAGLVADEYTVAPGELDCDCPPGRLCAIIEGGESFSCRGCTQGFYLPANNTVCHKCPKGSYQSEEAAQNCIPCPPGTSTLDTGSHNITQCNVSLDDMDFVPASVVNSNP